MIVFVIALISLPGFLALNNSYGSYRLHRENCKQLRTDPMAKSVKGETVETCKDLN
jgi:hypothetical protein